MQIPMRRLFLKKYELQHIKTGSRLVFDNPSSNYILYVVFDHSSYGIMSSNGCYSTALAIERGTNRIVCSIVIEVKHRIENSDERKWFRLPTEEEHKIYQKSKLIV